MICPVCVANAAVAAAGVSASTGGVAAIAMRVLRWRKTTAKPSRLAGAALRRSGSLGRTHAADEAAQRLGASRRGFYVGPEGPTP
jgi:hypothetical protein